MRIVLSGGSGFLGRALTAVLRREGHEVLVLTRHPRGAGDLMWSPDGGRGAWAAAVQAADAVINLAGEGLANRRWTTERKIALRSSRTRSTQALVRVLLEAARPAAVFLSSSAIGIYGDRGDHEVTEDAPAGSDFLAEVCVAWEHEALAAATITRVVLLRSGVVLASEGGALPRMALPYRLFAGGPLGSGQQYMSWIHLHDWIGMVRWALERADISGPLNVTAPDPVRNAEFARTLGSALHRPAFIPVPAFALRWLVGEMADVALLRGQRVIPAVAMANGFRFEYPELEGALRAIYAQK